MRSHHTTLTQQFPAIRTQAMTRHTVTRGARARIHITYTVALQSNPAELTQHVTVTLPPKT